MHHSDHLLLHKPVDLKKKQQLKNVIQRTHTEQQEARGRGHDTLVSNLLKFVGPGLQKFSVLNLKSRVMLTWLGAFAVTLLHKYQNC